MGRQGFLALVGAMSAMTSWAQELPQGYLCITEQAVGFGFNKVNKTWQRANFRADARYMVIKPKKTEAAWEVRKFGESIPTFECPGGYNSYGFLICEGLGGEFRFNKGNMRFMNAYLVGYWSDGPQPKDKLQSVEGVKYPKHRNWFVHSVVTRTLAEFVEAVLAAGPSFRRKTADLYYD